MEWFKRYIYSRPTEETLHLERVHLPDLTCPECDGGDVREYPIANYLGPRIVTKCQTCMHVLEIRKPHPDEPWPPFRAITFDWDDPNADRAKAPASNEQRAVNETEGGAR